MWARIVEFMLACWLALSPFIFHYPKESLFLWVNDYISASLIGFFSLICFAERLRKMHLCNVGMAMWLYLAGYFIPMPKAASENYIIVGLFLVMLAILPSESEKPPKSWRDFYSTL